MQKIIGLIEAHIEKLILAGCAGFMLYVAWGYLLGSPNKIEFNNEQVGPGNLYEKIKVAADQLDSAVRNAQPEEAETETFHEALQRNFEQGILTVKADEPTPPATLSIATQFGTKIEVAGLDQSEGSGDIKLVQPLKPTGIVTKVGRSMVYRQSLLVGLGGEEVDPDEDAEAVEQPWVTIAGYFDKKAQYTEMINAGYAGYRSRVYLVGVEVQRQEIESDGQFSEPVVVQSGEAMPTVEIPEPVFDDEDGSLANKSEMDEAFQIIKQQQPVLQQPPFFLVDAGDFWEVPELEGLEQPDEEEFEDNMGGPGMAAPTPQRPTGRSPAGGGMRPGATEGNPWGSNRPGATRGGGRFGGPAPSRQNTERDQKREARRRVQEKLKEAKESLQRKDWNSAMSAASQIETMDGSTAGDKKTAGKIIKKAEREMMRSETSFAGGALPPRTVLTEQTGFVQHPESGAPAVWFHDDSVESGKTYRYAMRVKLWNRYVGQTRSVADADDAKVPIMVGEWSEWGPPITVTPSTHFFISGGRDGQATCEVWKWRKGSWMKERFDVAVGDVVGGVKTVKTDELDEDLREVKADVDFTTGAVVLDMRFDESIKQRIPGKDSFSYREQDSVVIVYLDPADGQVKEKSAVLDRNDPLRKQLEDEAL